MIKRVAIGNVLGNLFWTVAFALAIRSDRVRKWLAPGYQVLAERVADEIERRVSATNLTSAIRDASKATR
jgi:hypothetical protein